MSEQRYGVHDCPNGFYYLRDVTDHSVYIHRNYGYLYSPYKEDIELVSTLLNELADKVDKQQSTIEQLQEENKELKHWKKRIIEYLSDWFNKTEYLTVLYKINEINNEIGLNDD